jgi:asparagine synthase (glutamine-hydrolysing)
MCGIAGIINTDGAPVDRQDLISMADALVHRGVDSEGYSLLGPGEDACTFHTRDSLLQTTAHGPCGFAHRRLAIIDLTNAGAQPMSTVSGSSWITYNGEIFNHPELRSELEQRGHRLRGHCDTEVLLQTFDKWGPDCLDRLNGMFAFALWDRRRGQLHLVRDRFGIEPLYYLRRGGSLAFASEPGALLALNWVRSEPDERAVADFLVHSRTESFDWTFFKGIGALPAGHSLTINLGEAEPAAPQCWWHMDMTGPSQAYSDDEAQEQTRALLASSVKLRLRSDVPLGFGLSGGLDSTSVLCLAEPDLDPADRQAFSIAYNGAFDEDETHHIDTAAAAAGVHSYRVAPTHADFLDDLEGFVRLQGEPVNAASKYAEYKVFELARQNGVHVAIGGHGADEILAGNTYFVATHLAGLVERGRPLEAWHELRSFNRINGAPMLSYALAGAAATAGHRTMIRWANRFDAARNVDWVSGRLHRMAKTLAEPVVPSHPDRLNRRLLEVFKASGLPAHLRYVDRNSMAVSVEARAPFLDHRLVSLAFSLPPHQKIRHGRTKYVLREAMKGTIPESVRCRGDERGAAVPMADWFRRALEPQLRSTFMSAQLRDRGWIKPDRLVDLLDRHCDGKVNAVRPLWRAWMLELWCRQHFG